LIRLEGNAVTFETSGLLSVKGAGHPFEGPNRTYIKMAVLPGAAITGPFQRKFQLRDAANGSPLPDLPYFIELRDGSFVHGRSDKDGYTGLALSLQDQMVQCHWGKEARKRIAKIA
jgi:type VI secretion system secreted protein VgrG